MNLVIVESPAKGKTIESYLGKGYKVVASFGHIRDLPKGNIGIDPENLEPKYVIPTKSRKQVTLLKKESAQAEKIILATDEDREGEAIAWHIVKALDLDENNKKRERIVFHEITKEAITKAIKEPREINKDLVDAQQARRVLDRLVGYNLSPLLWKKIRRGLSAGRVQSVALRLIVDREREIEAFKKDEYWEIETLLKTNTSDNEVFNASLIKKEGKKVEIVNGSEAKKIVEDLEDATYTVTDIVKTQKKRNPSPPFTTSSLQQEAARKLYFSAKKTMMVAQKLYEGIKVPGEGSVGLITYMRTDSMNLSNQSLSEIRGLITNKYGQNYLPEKPRYFKSKKGAQEAHEAIRPTSVKRTPESLKDTLTPDMFKLYQLIWNRTVASQMSSEILDLVRLDITAKKYLLRANGKQVKFNGFSRVYFEGSKKKQLISNKEVILPDLKVKDNCLLQEIIPNQKFTQPPARFTEASLVKTLEENGIGRPSTYAPTISTIKDRGYVKVEERKLVPQKIGFLVSDMLVENFPEIVDIKFTATMEEDLDKIAEGKLDWKEPVSKFWKPFSKEIEEKQEKIEKINMDVATDEVCEKCSKPLVLKEGRFGKFYACTGFPECKNTKPYLDKTGQKCPECKEGDVIIKNTKRGRTFWGCSRYPDCKWASWQPPKSE